MFCWCSFKLCGSWLKSILDLFYSLMRLVVFLTMPVLPSIGFTLSYNKIFSLFEILSWLCNRIIYGFCCIEWAHFALNFIFHFFLTNFKCISQEYLIPPMACNSCPLLSLLPSCYLWSDHYIETTILILSVYPSSFRNKCLYSYLMF